MPCFKPLQAFQPSTGGAPVFRLTPALERSGGSYNKIQLPCGQCIGCRLERSRQWAIRCVHEASLYERNCFITLTFNDQYLPEDRSLDVRHFQLFMKRLRKRFGEGIRFYHCGEYGEQFGRPHYHACLFNHDFDDKQLWRVNNGQKLYTSQALQDLWPYGYSSIGNVTFESAAYVARYIMKKINGKNADEHYHWVDYSTGEVHSLKPEYTTMSRRPGIGKGWYDRYSTDVYPSDEIILNETRMRPPRFYDRQYELTNPEDFENIKWLRSQSADRFVENNTPERLAVREKVQQARLEKLVRNLD